MLRSQKQRRVEHRCLEIVPATGRPCNLLFTRAWNLKRHQRAQHQDRGIVFMYYDPTAAQGNTTDPSATQTSMLITPVSNRAISTASPQATEMEHLRVPVTRAPWRPTPTTPPQAPSTPPTIIGVIPAQATSASPTSTQTAPGSKIPASVSPTSLPTAAVATNDFSPEIPRMEGRGPNSWMPETPVQCASSVQIPTPAMAESTSTPSEMNSARYLTQPANYVTPDRSRTVGCIEDSEDPTSESDASSYWTPLQSESASPVEPDFEEDETRSIGLELDSYREEHMSRLLASSEDSSGVSRKRKRLTERGRTVDARLKAAVPTYLVKRSKKTPEQQRGLAWLSASGKAHFNDNHGMLLAQWGVKAGHRGTCVLLPEDWKAMDPIDLMTTFENYNPPSGGSSRAWYSYSDHATTLARAAAWYGRWPRTGVELDNLLSCGPFKPMDGSHLCHHEHCIIHLTYESADTNMDRWNCCLEARFLRQDGRQIPEHCGKHRPPCLMQVSWVQYPAKSQSPY